MLIVGEKIGKTWDCLTNIPDLSDGKKIVNDLKWTEFNSIKKGYEYLKNDAVFNEGFYIHSVPEGFTDNKTHKSFIDCDLSDLDDDKFENPNIEYFDENKNYLVLCIGRFVSLTQIYFENCWLIFELKDENIKEIKKGIKQIDMRMSYDHIKKGEVFKSSSIPTRNNTSVGYTHMKEMFVDDTFNGLLNVLEDDKDILYRKFKKFYGGEKPDQIQMSPKDYKVIRFMNKGLVDADSIVYEHKKAPFSYMCNFTDGTQIYVVKDMIPGKIKMLDSDDEGFIYN